MSLQDGRYRFIPRDPTVRRNIDTSSVTVKILDKIINSRDGVTADELELRLGLKSSTVSARLKYMRDKGMIVDSGEKRPTRSGRLARVYLRRKR